MSYSVIASELAIPKSSVGYIVAQYKKRRSIASAPRSGRPQKTTAGTDRMFTREVLHDRKKSALTLSVQLSSSEDVKVSESTIRRRIKAMGLNGRTARSKPFLSKRHKEQRLVYAHAYRDWGVEWQSVLFTDESCST